MTATREGVANRRAEQMAEINKSREAQIDQELKDGGTADGIAVLARDQVAEGDGQRPADIPEEDWAAMSDEQKNIAIAEAKKKEEDAGAVGAGEAKEKEEADKKAAQDASAQAAAAASAAGGAGAIPKKFKGKVDGKEVEFDEQAVIDAGLRSLQKESAADRRLEEASRTSAEAQRLLTEAQNMIKAAAQGGAAAPDDGASPPAQGGRASIALTDEDLAKTVKAIQYGSEAEAKEALKGLIAAAANSGQSEELTQAQVLEMLDFREAKQWAETEYKDVLGDANLRTLFKTKEREKRAAGDTRPYRELYAEIGGEVRDWKKSLASAAPNPAPSGGSRAAALERKTALVPVPSAAARQPAPPTLKAETPSQTIDKMREARQGGRKT